MTRGRHHSNLAACMGRRSADHWKTATFGWLALVVVAFAVGGQVGTKNIDPNTSGPGQSGQMDRILNAGFKLPANFAPNRYSVIFHGVGLCDEYPASLYLEEYAAGAGYDGILEPGMTICVESYIGEVGGDEGVKLEQQILITDNGYEQLSTFPFEPELLPSRWL